MSTLIIPDGMKTGCLPRKTKFGECCSLFGEKIQVIPVREWSDLLGDVSLRPCVSKIKNQGNVGSCASEAVSQSVEIIRCAQGQEWVELNPWSVYWSVSGGRDQGSSIDENLVYVRANGVCPESIWPRSKGWKTKPSAAALEAAKLYRIDEFFDITSIEELGTALLKGFCVQFGWNGHSVVMVELLDTQTALYCNSWSESFGDQGFGTIKLSSVNFSYGAFCTRSVFV